MKNIILLTSIILGLSSAFGWDFSNSLFGNNTTNGYYNTYNNHRPYNPYRFQNSVFNNFNRLNYNRYHNHHRHPRLYNNATGYPNGFYNGSLSPNQRFNSFFRPRYQGLTGFSPSIRESLPTCDTNSYYINNRGAISCNHEVDGSATVRIIQD